jgi:hypothetical protein
MEDFFDMMSGAHLLGVELIDAPGLWQMLLRYVFNFIVTGIIIHFFYYPKSRRRDYYFTFTMIALSVFFIIFLLGGVKLKVGFVLGIFAIFGIIRYRTESVPIREMTYLFTITAIAVINGLSIHGCFTIKSKRIRQTTSRNSPPKMNAYKITGKALTAVFFFLVTGTTVYAQQDWGSSLTLEQSKKLFRKFEVTLGEEFRLRYDFSTPDRISGTTTIRTGII